MDGSIGYLNPGATFYAIDTTKLPKGEGLGHGEQHVPERLQGAPQSDGRRHEGRGVRLAHTAERHHRVKVSDMYNGTLDSNQSKLETLQSRITWDKKYSITFNPEYQP